MSDYSWDNQGYCRRHRCRVLLDEGCDLCNEEKPHCYACGRTMTVEEVEVDPCCFECTGLYPDEAQVAEEKE